jgi:hypothetical protein
MPIAAGDQVKVSVHGEDRFALAEVLICSANQRSIAVAFDDKPHFARYPLQIDKRDGRIVMLLRREAVENQPVGPWIEVMNGGHYEIEKGEPA